MCLTSGSLSVLSYRNLACPVGCVTVSLTVFGLLTRQAHFREFRFVLACVCVCLRPWDGFMLCEIKLTKQMVWHQFVVKTAGLISQMGSIIYVGMIRDL